MRKGIKYFFTNLLVVCFLISIISATAFANIGLEDYRASTMQIVVLQAGADIQTAQLPAPPDGHRMVSGGSAFVIGERGEAPYQYVVTCAHVINPDHYTGPVDIYIWRSRDSYVPVEPFRVLERSDLAILQVPPDLLLYTYEPLPLSSRENVAAHQKATSIGFPIEADTAFNDFPSAYPENASIDDGTISRFTTLDGVRLIQFSALASWGHSGGPLVDEDGGVIGVITRGVDFEDMNAAVEIDYLRSELDLVGIQYDDAGDVVAPDPNGHATAIRIISAPTSAIVGEEVALEASVTNNADQPRDLEVSFYANGSLFSSERVSQLAPGQSTNISTAWSAQEPGDNQIEVRAGDAASTFSINVGPETTEPPWLIIVLAAAALLIVVLAVLLAMRSRKTSTVPAMATPSMPSPQQITAAAGPVTRTRPERDSAPAVTQAKRQAPRPVIKGVSGHFAGQTLELVENQIVIGRDPRLAQLVYPQDREEISRKHLTIRFDDKTHKFNLVDSSSNGTYLSSKQKLEPSETYYLNPGDKFYLTDPNESFEVKVES